MFSPFYMSSYLQMSSEAEQAFTQVLKLDKNCEDAVQELLRVRTHQIMVSHGWRTPYMVDLFVLNHKVQ